ncbi:MAG: glycosyltransferase family 2 protein [Halobacteriovoraceae bacterium]|jgi:glycosyltransferase involved in cell wall biosynthesis|nr:glycosyltransferase family 2 protein [Halobacteriovoraceae bacterium]
MEKDTVIVIPTFNERQGLPLVLKEIPMERVLQVIVVDNGSTDSSAQVAAELGARVIKEPQKGYGKACLSGIEEALTLSPNVIAFLDADYSDNPAELTLLLKEIDRGAELVIGSRTLGLAEVGALLPQAIFGNWLSTGLLKFLYGGNSFSDLGPFRAIRTKSLLALRMRDQTFGWTVEMQAKALLLNLKCSEISVSYKKRIGVSKITGTFSGTVKAGVKILSTLFWLRLKWFFKKDFT